MKNALLRHAEQAAKAKPVPTAPEAPTAAPAARHWAMPDPGAYAALKCVEAPRTKPETLDRRMVAELAKLSASSALHNNLIKA